MNLTSPLGTAGIRGTMFQLMAVRNSLSGDISGGINLISGDIDFTDTGGNMVTLLSGQSIQLATGKLGEPVASQTGELVDLSSTYGPALSGDGLPPPLETIFPSLQESGEDESEEGEDSGEDVSGGSDSSFASSSTATGGGNWDFIQQMATDIFEIEETEQSSSEFTFESIATAVEVETPTPLEEAPTAPAKITGETEAGELPFQGPPPVLGLLGEPSQNTPLFKIEQNAEKITVDMSAPGGPNWFDLDPRISAEDFLGNDISESVQILGVPQIVFQIAQPLIPQLQITQEFTLLLTRFVMSQALPLSSNAL